MDGLLSNSQIRVTLSILLCPQIEQEAAGMPGAGAGAGATRPRSFRLRKDAALALSSKSTRRSVGANTAKTSANKSMIDGSGATMMNSNSGATAGAAAPLKSSGHIRASSPLPSQFAKKAGDTPTG